MSKQINILVVEDSEDDYFLLMRELKKAGYNVVGNRVETSGSLEEAFQASSYDLIFSDNNLPTLNAPKALEIARQNSSAPFIIVSGTISEEAAVNAMRMGANDYIFKGNLSRLLPAVRRELRESENRLKRKEAEQALDTTEKQFKTLAESIGDIFFALNNELECTYWNSEAEKATSTPAENAIGQKFDVLFPDMPPIAYKTIQQAIKEQKRKTVTIEQNDGQSSYFELICYPYAGGISIIIKDITKAKKTALKLEKVNKELETFMYRLSHDLKGPVASMIGLVDLARKDLHGKTAMQYCDMFDSSAKNLKEVLETLLDVTKIKTGDVKLSDISLTQVTEKVINRLLFRTKHVGAKITYPNTDLVLYSDAVFVTSVLQNLVENAIKYGGSETENPRVYIGWEEKADQIIITIADNGPGVPKDFRNKIFEMFYRANETKSGSGLGLYIVKSAVEAIGGTITLKSQENKGSAFTIALPKKNKNWI